MIFRRAAYACMFLILSACGFSCGTKTPVRDVQTADAASSVPPTDAEAPPKTAAPEAAPITIGEAMAGSAIVTYNVPDGPYSSVLIVRSGVVLDAHHVLTVVIEDLPRTAATPRVNLHTEDGSHEVETDPKRRVVLDELGLQVLTTMEPLGGAAVLAPKHALDPGEELFVIGSYLESWWLNVMHGNVMITNFPGRPGTFLVNATQSESTEGAGVYDERHALVGVIIHASLIHGELKSDVGLAHSAEAIVQALDAAGVTYTTTDAK